MIRPCRLPLLLCLGFASLCVPRPPCGWCPAAEIRPLEFLRALQEKDYYDVAEDYLEFLKKNNELPSELAAVWDLEMAKSLRGMAATRAFDARDFERLAAEAEKHLNKFLQEKPDHPEVAHAMLSGAMFSVDRAMYHLREARALGDKDPQQKAKRLTDARALLEESRPRLRQAIQRLEARIAALPALPKASAARTSARPRTIRLSATLWPSASAWAVILERPVSGRPRGLLLRPDLHRSQGGSPQGRAGECRGSHGPTVAAPSVGRTVGREPGRPVRPHVARQDHGGVGRLPDRPGHL